MIPVHATGAQIQQRGNGLAPAERNSSYVPYVTGTQVAGLWSGEPYGVQWLMTDDGHITGFGTTPEHTLLDR